jgi:predicted dehydrogenase
MDDWLSTYDERDWQTVTSGTVRYALVGLGWWTVDIVLPALESSSLCEVTTLVSSTTEKAQECADDHDVERGISYEEFHEGEAQSAYDAIYVATPNALHLDYVKTAAALDKAVLCEKPMESTVERAERLVEACEEADVPLMIAYRMQTDPAVRRARHLVAEGFLGEPVSVYGSNSQPLLEMNPNPDQWRLDPDLSGYGTSVMDLGIYSINTARFLLRRDPVAVQAQMHSGHEAFADMADERAGAVLALEDDVQFVTTTSQRAHAESQLKLTGTEGQIELRPAFHGECTLHLSRGDVSATIDHDGFDVQREMREEFEYFADRILGETEVYPDGRHGLEDMRIIRAIHEAAESGDTVTL